MANEADLKLIEIGEFEQTSAVAGTGEEFIVVRKADGKTYKMSTADFRAFLGTVQVQVPRAISPTDPAPTLPGVYRPTVSGTYANLGGLVIDMNGKLNEVLYDGSTFANVVTELPETDLSGVVPKADIVNNLEEGGSSKVASAETVKQLRQNIGGFAEVQTGANLVNPAEIIRGWRIDTAANGANLIPWEGGITTGYIRVIPGKRYTGFGFHSVLRSYFQNIGDTIPVHTSSSGTATIPTDKGINYVVINISINGDEGGIGGAMLYEYNDVMLPYEPYVEEWRIREEALPPIPDPIDPDLFVKKTEFDTDLKENLEKVAEVKTGKNLINPAELIRGKRVSTAATGGLVIDWEGGIMTGYIPVKKGVLYSQTAAPSVTRSYFKNIGDTEPVYVGTSQTIVTPEDVDANYAVFNLNVNGDESSINQVMFNEGNPMPYEPYSEEWKIKEEALPEGGGASRGISGTPLFGNFNRPFKTKSMDDVSIGQPFDLAASVSSDIYAFYDALMAQYPDAIKKTFLRNGGNIDNVQDPSLPIYEYEITNPFLPPPGQQQIEENYYLMDSPLILMTSGVHGEEKTTPWGIFQFIKQMFEDWSTDESLESIKANVRFKIIPIVNPGGYNISQRTNLNGYNLNRGIFVSPQQESIMLREWLMANKEAFMYVDYHNSGEGIIKWSYGITRTESQMEVFSSMIRFLSPRWKRDYGVYTDNWTRGYLREGGIETGGYIYDYARDVAGIERAATLEVTRFFNGIQFSSETIEMTVDLIANFILGNLDNYSRAKIES